MAMVPSDITKPATDTDLVAAVVRGQQQALFSTDFAPLRVRAQTSRDMTVQVASAAVESFWYPILDSAGLVASYVGGNSATIVAPSGNDRIDAISLSTSNTITVTGGTPGASPVEPDMPAGEIPLAYIYLVDSCTSICNYEDKDTYPTEGYVYKDMRPWLRFGSASAGGGESAWVSFLENFAGDGSNYYLYSAVTNKVTGGTASSSSGTAVNATVLAGQCNIVGTGDTLDTDWWKYDFGAGNAFVMKSIQVYGDNSTADILQVKIQGSNDDSVWDTLALQTWGIDTVGMSSAYHTFSVPNSTAYRYYRLSFISNCGHGTYIVLRQFRMYGPDELTLSGGSYTVGADTEILPSIVHCVNNLTIDAGYTLSIPPTDDATFSGHGSQYDDIPSKCMFLCIKGNLVVNGTLDVSECGAVGGVGTGAAGGNGCSPGGGGGDGDGGGTCWWAGIGTAGNGANTLPARSLLHSDIIPSNGRLVGMNMWGSGGGSYASGTGGHGGGVLVIEVTGNVTIGAAGSIKANGGAGVTHSGGGGGGVILIAYKGTLSNSGAVEAYGGDGAGNGRAGGRGVVKLVDLSA